jgi:hypothetical protein
LILELDSEKGEIRISSALGGERPLSKEIKIKMNQDIKREVGLTNIPRPKPSNIKIRPRNPPQILA